MKTGLTSQNRSERDKDNSILVGSVKKLLQIWRERFRGSAVHHSDLLKEYSFTLSSLSQRDHKWRHFHQRFIIRQPFLYVRVYQYLQSKLSNFCWIVTTFLENFDESKGQTCNVDTNSFPYKCDIIYERSQNPIKNLK